MKVGFIGCGNMGGALATAIQKNTDVTLLLADRDGAKRDALASRLSAEAREAGEIARQAELIYLGVKPHLVRGVLAELAEDLSANAGAVVVSMAAGVTLQALEEALPKGVGAIRIMPNTAVAVGEGMVVYAAGAGVSPEREADFRRIMAPTGKVDALPENLIDAATAVMGCGPAFAYLFLEALADGGVSCGLPREKAALYAAQMLRGAAELALTSGKHPEALKDEVCSPGGSTIAGVGVLDRNAFRGITRDAVTAAYEKTRSLGK